MQKRSRFEPVPPPVHYCGYAPATSPLQKVAKKSTKLCILLFLLFDIFLVTRHYVKCVRIRSYSGPYSVRMLENTDQNNFEYGQLLSSESEINRSKKLVTLQRLKW